MDLNKIRYKGDLLDTKELYNVYKVKQIIDSHEEILKEHISFRDELLANSVRLTSVISPRIYKIIEKVKALFAIKENIEFFSLNDNSYNAFAFKQRKIISIVFTAALLENFSDAEILFVLGHELGHILYDHNRLLLLYSPNKKRTTFLSILAEKKFLSWQKKAEISSDRVGLLACKNYQTAIQSLLKGSYGLTEKNLNFNLPELMKQLDDLAQSEYLSQLSTATHPLLPVRLKALELFYHSTLYSPKGKINTKELSQQIGKLISLTNFYPRKKTNEQMMKFIAAAAVAIISADKEINIEKIKSLVKILANVFTDNPEKEIIYDKKKVESQLKGTAKYLYKNASDDEKFYALHFLTVITLADGKLTTKEKKMLLTTAASIGFSKDDAMDVLWKTLQQNGISIDVRLNEIAQNVKIHYSENKKKI
ncbi:MAG: M48 family metallopeptidase [Candidatus Cloacimonetes bacterium]|nr:M48 family metallopeptidase [Candidatus Cloacimonadota bacterium]